MDTRPAIPRRFIYDSDPTIPPAVGSFRPSRPYRRFTSWSAGATGAGVVIGVAIFVLAWTLARPSEAQQPARAEVTVGDARGVLAGAVDVYVDGVLECESTPCTIDATPGAHQVELRVAHGGQRLQREVTLDRAQYTAIHFALPPATEPASRPDEPISVNALPIEQSPETAPTTSPVASGAPLQAPLRAPSAKPAWSGSSAPRGLLNLNSIPIANVVLDGRPLGTTPLVGVDVPAGSHSVTFVHPELGRRSATIQIDGGQRKAVVVRFAAPAASED